MAEIYLDTSAYFATLTDEKTAPEVARTIGGRSVCSSSILLMETERNLLRYLRERRFTLDEYSRVLARFKFEIPTFELRDFTLDLCLTHEFPAVKIPRSCDMIHLRTAKWFQNHGGLDLFLTLDDDMCAAAEEMNLPVRKLETNKPT